MIHNANIWASPILDALWRASWQGGIFIAVIWMACRLFKRMPAWAKHWLWWVACFQMAVRLFLSISIPVLPATEIASDAPAIEAPLSALTIQPPQLVATRVAQAVPSGISAAPIPKAPVERPSLALALVAGWLLGCFVLLALSFRHLLALRKLLRGSRQAEAQLEELVGALASEMGVKAPKVRIAKDAPCPMLAGWLKPTIILPEWAADLENRELELALYHELVHLKRRDLWLALLPASVKCLFFFHPLAWLAAHETSLACEEACDLETLSLSSGSPATYARLLLHSAQTKSSVVALGTAFGFRSLHRRITMLKRLNLSAPARRTRSLTIIIALAAVCALPWSVTAQSTGQVKHHMFHTSRGHRGRSHVRGAKSHKAAAVASAAKVSPAKPSAQVAIANREATQGLASTSASLGGLSNRQIFADPISKTTVVTTTSGGLTTTRVIPAPRGGFGGGVSIGTTIPQQSGMGGFSAAPASPQGISSSRATAPQAGMGGFGVAQAPSQGIGGGSSGAPSAPQAVFGGGGIGGGSSAGFLAPGAAIGRGQRSGSAGFGGGGMSASNQSGVTMVQPPVAIGMVGHGPSQTQSQGSFTVSGGGLGGGGQATGFEAVCEVQSNGGDRVTARFQNVNLRRALTKLFETAHVDFTIKSDVAYTNMVTCGFNNATVDDVLRAMLDSVDQKVTYRVERGMYMVSAREGD